MLVKLYGWSLYEIDMTHIESLIPFVMQARRAGSVNGRGPGSPIPATGKAFCDQVSWL